MAQQKERKIPNKPVNRYVLEKYNGVKSRHYCKNCGGKHSYTRFIDVTTGEYLPEEFGRCDKVEKCGYFNPPTGKDLKDKPMMVKPGEALKEYQEEENLGISLIDSAKVLESLTFNDHLSQFLFNNFDPIKVKDTLVRYKLGESSKWKGSTVFWQIDRDFDARTGKIILYDLSTGKRLKNPRPFISWEHVPERRLLDRSYLVDYNLKQCLFGEHLVTPETTEIHIVESEKTALLCNIIDGKTWLAVGGIEMINEERLLPFKHCKMTFYPDKGPKALEKWKKKLSEFSEVFDIKVNTSLEKSNLPEGSDLGDLIIEKFGKKHD
jgi:hypothetical protein